MIDDPWVIDFLAGGKLYHKILSNVDRIFDFDPDALIYNGLDVIPPKAYMD